MVHLSKVPVLQKVQQLADAYVCNCVDVFLATGLPGTLLAVFADSKMNILEVVLVDQSLTLLVVVVLKKFLVVALKQQGVIL